jgi:hypothetical protein
MAAAPLPTDWASCFRSATTCWPAGRGSSIP